MPRTRQSRVTTRSWEFRLLFTLNVVSEGSERVAALRAARERREGFLERFLQGVEKEQMSTRILLASDGGRHGPRVTSHESPVTSCKLFRFTLLSKNAPANHLESHSCKNKGLKVPCFHTLTKKGVGEGGPPRVRTRITNHQFTQRPDPRAEGSRLTSHQSPITTGGGYTRFRLSTVDCQLRAARTSWEPR